MICDLSEYLIFVQSPDLAKAGNVKDMSDKTDELEIELYKNLKQEAQSYIEKVPALWLQKFALIGAVIVFTLTKEVPQQYNYLVTLGFIVIPFLALILDAKVLEFSLHARVISRYIARTFNDPKSLSEWEYLFWGKNTEDKYEDKNKELWLVEIRSLTTIAVQTIPTCMLIVISSIILGEIWRINFSFIIGLVISGIYIALILYLQKLIFNK